MRHVLLVAVLLLATPPAWAAEWFISNAGSDSNPCTQAQPCLTLDRATDVGGPGDTFSFRGGTYGENITQGTNIPSGTSDSNPTIVRGYPGEVAVLTRGFNLYYDPFGAGPYLEYVVFSNFVVDGGNYSPLGKVRYVTIQDTEFKHCYNLDNCAGQVAGSGAHGGGVFPSHHMRYIRLHIHDTGYDRAAKDPGGHCVYACTPYMVFRDSDIHNCGNIGMQIYSSGDDGCSDNSEIYNNRIHDNSSCDNGATIDYGDNLKVYNNIFYNNHGPGGSGICDALAFPFGSIDNLQVHNNTMYNNDTALSFGNPSWTLTNIQVRNNIMWGNSTDVPTVKGPVTFTASQTNLCGQSGAHCEIVANPQFTNAAGGDFTVTASSLARNGGTSVSVPAFDIAYVSRPQGSAWDIGAYEYVEGGGPAFDFLVASPGTKTIQQGTSVNFPVTATYNGGTAQPVTWSVSSLPSGVSAGFTNSPCTPTCTATMTLTATGGATLGTFTNPLLAAQTSGGLVRDTNFTIIVTAPTAVFDFSLGTPGPQTLSQSAAIDVPIVASLVSGTAAPVTFSVTAGLPTGVTPVFTNSPCTPPCTATLTLTASPSATTGTAPLTVQGVGGSQTHTATFDLTVTPVTSSSNPIYVAQTGGLDTRSCTVAETASTPLLTIAKALTCMTIPGKIMYIKAGTYIEKIDTLIQPITGGNGPSYADATTIASFGTDDVTIQLPSGASPAVLLFLQRGAADKYLVFKGSAGHPLVFDAANRTDSNTVVFYPGVNHIRFEYVEAKNTLTGFETVYGLDSSNIEWFQSSIHHSQRAGVRLDGTNTNWLFQNATIHTNTTRGIDQTSGTVTGLTIRESTIRDNTTDGLRLWTSTGAVIKNTLIYDNGGGGGIGVQLLTGASDTRLYNSNVYSNTGTGVQCDTLAGGAIAPQLTNNILFGNATNLVNTCGATLTTNLTVDPLFVAPPGNQAVQNGSLAIDTGTTLPAIMGDFTGQPRQQCQQDIGAYERDQASTMTLSWDYTLGEQAEIDGFILQRRVPSGTYADLGSLVSNTVRTTTDSTALVDTTYCYQLLGQKTLTTPPMVLRSAPSNEVCGMRSCTPAQPPGPNTTLRPRALVETEWYF